MTKRYHNWYIWRRDRGLVYRYYTVFITPFFSIGKNKLKSEYLINFYKKLSVTLIKYLYSLIKCLLHLSYLLITIT